MRQRVTIEEVKRMTVVNDTILNFATSMESTILGESIIGFFPEEEPITKNEENIKESQ